ncbi:MAG: hypothetical protein ACLR0N_10715 [Bilophila wadsworthia]
MDSDVMKMMSPGRVAATTHRRCGSAEPMSSPSSDVGIAKPEEAQARL